MSVVDEREEREAFFREALEFSVEKVSTENLVNKIEEKAGKTVPRLGENIDIISK